MINYKLQDDFYIDSWVSFANGIFTHVSLGVHSRCLSGIPYFHYNPVTIPYTYAKFPFIVCNWVIWMVEKYCNVFLFSTIWILFVQLNSIAVITFCFVMCIKIVSQTKSLNHTWRTELYIVDMVPLLLSNHRFESRIEQHRIFTQDVFFFFFAFPCSCADLKLFIDVYRDWQLRI